MLIDLRKRGHVVAASTFLIAGPLQDQLGSPAVRMRARSAPRCIATWPPSGSTCCPGRRITRFSSRWCCPIAVVADGRASRARLLRPRLRTRAISWASTVFGLMMGSAVEDRTGWLLSWGLPR